MKDEFIDLNKKGFWGKAGKYALDTGEAVASFFGLGDAWNNLVKDIGNWFGVGDKTFPNANAVIKYVKDALIKIKQKDAVKANQLANRIQSLPLPKSANTKTIVGDLKKSLNRANNELAKRQTKLATAEESAISQASSIDFAKNTNKAKIANQIVGDFDKTISNI